MIHVSHISLSKKIENNYKILKAVDHNDNLKQDVLLRERFFDGNTQLLILSWTALIRDRNQSFSAQ